MWDASEPLAGSDGALYLERRGISTNVAVEAGVRFSPNWYGRSPAVVFPIYNRRGELVAANGRFNDEGVKPKMQTAGRKKLGVFTTPDALSNSLVAVTEAPLDALTLWQCGISAVAMVGTSWPDWLPTALAFKSVLVATDADAAGDESATKLIFALNVRGARPFRLRPKGGKDWNELLGTGGLKDLRERLSAYSQGADDESRVNASRKLFKEGCYEEAEFIAALVQDAYTREIYRTSLRQRLRELKAA
jgi:DNA primase